MKYFVSKIQIPKTDWQNRISIAPWFTPYSKLDRNGGSTGQGGALGGASVQ